jgi:hypothetical protein
MCINLLEKRGEVVELVTIELEILLHSRHVRITLRAISLVHAMRAA